MARAVLAGGAVEGGAGGAAEQLLAELPSEAATQLDEYDRHFVLHSEEFCCIRFAISAKAR